MPEGSVRVGLDRTACVIVSRNAWGMEDMEGTGVRIPVPILQETPRGKRGIFA
jgi:hypothetical protein